MKFFAPVSVALVVGLLLAMPQRTGAQSCPTSICACPCTDLGGSGAGIDPNCHKVLDFSKCGFTLIDDGNGCCPVDPACPNRKCRVLFDIKGNWGNCPCAGRVRITLVVGGGVVAQVTGSGPQGAQLAIQQELKCGTPATISVDFFDCNGNVVATYSHSFGCEFPSGGCP